MRVKVHRWRLLNTCSRAGLLATERAGFWFLKGAKAEISWVAWSRNMRGGIPSFDDAPVIDWAKYEIEYNRALSTLM